MRKYKTPDQAEFTRAIARFLKVPEESVVYLKVAEDILAFEYLDTWAVKTEFQDEHQKDWGSAGYDNIKDADSWSEGVARRIKNGRDNKAVAFIQNAVERRGLMSKIDNRDFKYHNPSDDTSFMGSCLSCNKKTAKPKIKTPKLTSKLESHQVRNNCPSVMCVNGRVNCSSCNGSGWAGSSKCQWCWGKGYNTCKSCGGSGYTTSTSYSTSYSQSHHASPSISYCKTCGGTKRIAFSREIPATISYVDRRFNYETTECPSILTENPVAIRMYTKVGRFQMNEKGVFVVTQAETIGVRIACKIGDRVITFLFYANESELQLATYTNVGNG